MSQMYEEVRRIAQARQAIKKERAGSGESANVTPRCSQSVTLPNRNRNTTTSCVYSLNAASTLWTVVVCLSVCLSLSYYFTFRRSGGDQKMKKMTAEAYLHEPSRSAAVLSLAGKPTGSLGGFIVQVGAMKNKKNAFSLRERLVQEAFPVSINEFGADSLYRVIVGPYPDLQSAQGAAVELKRQGFAVLVKRNPMTD